MWILAFNRVSVAIKLDHLNLFLFDLNGIYKEDIFVH